MSAPPAHDEWSSLSPGEWVGVFVAGFCAMVLFFFRFYAGVFAREIYEERGLEVAALTRLALEGTLPLSAGIVAAAAVLASLLPPLGSSRGGRRAALAAALGVGLLGLVATLWGLYGPLL